MPGFRFGSTLRTWLHRIAYNEYLHWRKSLRPEGAQERIEGAIGPSGLPSADSLALESALRRLPSDQRETFLLFYQQELSVKEIAEAMEVPPGTVKSRLSAARGKLRGLMAEEAASETETSQQYAVKEVRS